MDAVLLKRPSAFMPFAMSVAALATVIGYAAMFGTFPARSSLRRQHSSFDLVRWFQATEQALMDSVAPGDKTVWERVMDPGCVVTSEEGQVLTKEQFLKELRPLPPGLTGGIRVRDLTVQDFSTFAVVKYVADE
jgi:hypothetical protein